MRERAPGKEGREPNKIRRRVEVGVNDVKELALSIGCVQTRGGERKGI